MVRDLYHVYQVILTGDIAAALQGFNLGPCTHLYDSTIILLSNHVQTDKTTATE